MKYVIYSPSLKGFSRVNPYDFPTENLDEAKKFNNVRKAQKFIKYPDSDLEVITIDQALVMTTFYQ